MTFSLTWLPGVLRAAGLRVVEQPGWQTRGHGDVGKTQFILCHHTAAKIGTSTKTTLDLITYGRPDLKGPLSQLFLSKDGTFYVVAAGVGYHAGAGNWQGITTGNSSSIGIEADNNGIGEPWPEVQMEPYARGCAAILKHIKAPPIMCAGHKEYALPKGRKIDPNFDMDKFRERVSSVMAAERPTMHAMLVPLLKRWETYVQRATVDKGKDKPLVIGFGHTNANNYPPTVTADLVLRDEAQALEILLGELNTVYVPQLNKLFQKIDFKPPNALYYSGFLDALYNRGAGRLVGADAGSELKGSYAWHILKNMRGEKNWMVKAANALTLSHVEDFTPLDEAWDDELQADRIYEGLTARRACDTALCLWERF